MSGRKRRIGRGVVLAVVALVLLGAAGAWALLYTAPGLRVAWGFVERRLPPTLDVERVTGRLAGPLDLHGIEYVSGPTRVEVSEVRVDWELGPLLRRSLHVRDMRVRGVVVHGNAAGMPRDSAAADTLPLLASPVHLTVARTLMTDITVLSPSDTVAPLTLDSVTVTDATYRSELGVASLVAVGSPGRLRASGRVTTSGRYPFHLETTWEGTHPELGAVSGSLNGSGDLDLVSFALAVSHPAEIELDGEVADPLDRRVIDAELTVAETDFATVMPEASEGRAGGTFELAGTADSLRVTGEGRVTTPSIGAVDVDAAIELLRDSVRVERFTARQGRTRVDLDGGVLLGPDGPVMDLALVWSAVRWPAVGPVRVRSDAGSARLVGTTASYRVDGQAGFVADTFPAARVRLRGVGTAERMDFSELTLQASSATVSGTGEVTWSPDIRWNVEVAGRDVDLADFVPDTAAWSGRVAFDGHSRGSVVGSRVRADITVDTLQGSVRGERVGASGSTVLAVSLSEAGPRWDGATVDLRWLEAEWGENHLFAAGTVADTLYVHWSLNVPEVDVVLPGGGGTLQGRGRFTGPRDSPNLETTMLAQNVVTESMHVAELSIGGVVESRRGGTVDLSAMARDVTIGTGTIDSLDLEVRGGPQSHALTARLVAPRQEVHLSASGGVTDGRWAGSIENVEVALDQVGRWTLDSSVDVSLSRTAARIDRGCVRSGAAEVCAQASWAVDDLASAGFEVTGLPNELLVPSLPEGWSLTGAWAARGAATLTPDGTITASFTADGGSGVIGYPSTAGPRRLRYSAATVEAEIDDDGTRSTFRTAVTDDRDREVVTLVGNLDLPDFANINDSLVTQPVAGELDARVVDFSAVETFFSEAQHVAGDFELDVEVSGTVGGPEFLGEARLRDGALDVPELGLELRDIDVTARGRGDEGVTIEGALRSGTGRVTITGDIPVSPSATNPSTLLVRGERVHVVALPEADIWVTPDLEVRTTPQQMSVSGRVRIPTARVALSEVPETAIRPSRDVVFVGDTTAAVRRLRALSLDVRVELGDSVSFQGFGLSADPTGEVVVSDASGGATVATGEITLENGRYRAYGQDLTMERGRLLYAGGPAENPGLDIRATRTARDGVVAGLDIGGTLRRPEVTIFSDPTMLESEALAYIVLGRPLGTATSSEGGQVAEAATVLGLRGGNVLAGRIGERFGLSEVRVAADGPLEEALLVAGKYLSPALYVSYGVGLFEPISTFRLRYLLSGKWTLSAESGRVAGVDLLYRIERGR